MALDFMEVCQRGYFGALASVGSFTAAAKKRHATQPSLNDAFCHVKFKYGQQSLGRWHHKLAFAPLREAFLPMPDNCSSHGPSDTQTAAWEPAFTTKYADPRYSAKNRSYLAPGTEPKESENRAKRWMEKRELIPVNGLHDAI
jgi:hypothetical protein